MPPALWLIVLPVGAIPVVYLLRRTGWGVAVAAGIALTCGWLVLQLPLGLILNILGRPVALDQLSQISLALIFAATALLFLIAYPLTTHTLSKQDTGRGRTFHTVGLAILSIFVAAGLSRHLGITALLVEGAVILAVVIIQGRRLESTRAAQRFLVLMSLAVPLFLLAAWRIDQYELSGEIYSTRYLQQTAVLIAAGFALWLAVWPFHSWQSTTATEASPTAAAFILITFPIMALSTLMHLLADSPWLTTALPLPWIIILAGVLTALVGGVLASVQRNFSSLMGCTAVYDLGVILAILGLGGQTVMIMILIGLVVRALALALIAASLLAFKLHTPDDGFAQMAGLARRLPIATAGMIIGGLTLTGAPLTIGFPYHWRLLQSIAQVDTRWPFLLILAGLGITIGYLRGLRALLASAQPATKPSTENSFSRQEPLSLLIIISVLAGACILLGLVPSLLIEPLQQLSAGLSLPIN